MFVLLKINATFGHVLRARECDLEADKRDVMIVAVAELAGGENASRKGCPAASE